MDGPGDKRDDKVWGGSDETPARFQSQFEAVVTSRANIGEAAPSTCGDVFSLALRHSEAVAGLLEECQDAKVATHWRAS